MFSEENCCKFFKIPHYFSFQKIGGNDKDISFQKINFSSLDKIVVKKLTL